MKHSDSRIQHADARGAYGQLEFEQLLDELGMERMEKVIMYGNDRYEVEDPEVNAWLSYCDTRRKFQRLLALTRARNNSALRETYLELASYALLAVQMIDLEKQ